MAKDIHSKEAILQLNEFLEPDNRANRFALRKLFSSDPIFIPKFNLTLKEERELALARLKKFCPPSGQFISVYGKNYENDFCD